ncbi:MAG TPA: AzlC family ABC transporter permease [Acidimicrobiia bacterium]|nr:AzlC family ABC transporter permease [Acidimicrobiia bacterium]
MLSNPDVRRGLEDTFPVLVPVVPFALVLGLAIAESPLSNLVGWLGSSLIFGGAAQLTVVTLSGEGAALLAVIAAGLIVQARHLMYSAAFAPVFGKQPRWFRWLGPYFLIDQQFALTSFRMGDPPDSFRTYYLTVGLTFWVTWQATVALGLVVGPVLPESWSLGFAVPLMFVGLLVLAVNSSPSAAAAVAAGAVTWMTLGVPNRLGIVLGAIAGVVAGLVAGRR